jgi:hypothetical protein
MRKAILLLLAVTALSAFAAEVTVKGYLVDIACGTEEGSRPDFGIKHTKGCLQMPECEKSGYGVLTPDHNVIRFDYPGNQRAKQFIAELKKNNDVKVAVTGAVSGGMMTVSKIELQ